MSGVVQAFKDSFIMLFIGSVPEEHFSEMWCGKSVIQGVVIDKSETNLSLPDEYYINSLNEVNVCFWTD
jgi:hypothetical protein